MPLVFDLLPLCGLPAAQVQPQSQGIAGKFLLQLLQQCLPALGQFCAAQAFQLAAPFLGKQRLVSLQLADHHLGPERQRSLHLSLGRQGGVEGQAAGVQSEGHIPPLLLGTENGDGSRGLFAPEHQQSVGLLFIQETHQVGFLEKSCSLGERTLLPGCYSRQIGINAFFLHFTVKLIKGHIRPLLAFFRGPHGNFIARQDLGDRGRFQQFGRCVLPGDHQGQGQGHIVLAAEIIQHLLHPVPGQVGADGHRLGVAQIKPPAGVSRCRLAGCNTAGALSFYQTAFHILLAAFHMGQFGGEQGLALGIYIQGHARDDGQSIQFLIIPAASGEKQSQGQKNSTDFILHWFPPQ